MMITFLAIVAAATGAGDCEVWCSNPCKELNGNPNVECAGCDESLSLIHI